MVQETDRLTWNQFQKELNDRGIDKQLGYMLSIVYERCLENARQVDMCANTLLQMANQIQRFVELHARTQQGLDMLMKEMRGDANIDVKSVANDPNDMH